MFGEGISKEVEVHINKPCVGTMSEMGKDYSSWDGEMTGSKEHITLLAYLLCVRGPQTF